MRAECGTWVSIFPTPGVAPADSSVKMPPGTVHGVAHSASADLLYFRASGRRADGQLPRLPRYRRELVQSCYNQHCHGNAGCPVPGAAQRGSGAERPHADGSELMAEVPVPGNPQARDLESLTGVTGADGGGQETSLAELSHAGPHLLRAVLGA